MPAYNITKSDGTPIVIPEGAIATNLCDIPLVGQNAVSYGDDVATAFIRLLENFAAPTAPNFGGTGKRFTGQLWYDTNEGVLKVWNGVSWEGATGSSIPNAYATVSDGTNTATASGGDTLRFRSGSSALTIVVSNNDITYNDNVLLTINPAGVDHNSLLNYSAQRHLDHSSLTVTGGSSVTGGGDLTASRVLTLVNDNATPGASKYYGTDGGGTKGFFSLPAVGGGGNSFQNFNIVDTDSGYTWSATGLVVADTTTDTISFVSGAGIDINADVTNDAVRVSHADTSSVSNLVSNNSNGIVLQSLTLSFDNYGHVTAQSAATVNLDTRYTRAAVNETITGAWVLRDAGDYSIGWRDIPQNPQSSQHQLVLSDRGKHISITTGGILVPTNASVTFPVGTTIVVFNNSSSSQTIQAVSPGTTLLQLAATSTAGTRTLAAWGLATLMKVSADLWIIGGIGVT